MKSYGWKIGRAKSNQLLVGNQPEAALSLRDAFQESDGKLVPFSQGNLVLFLSRFGCLILSLVQRALPPLLIIHSVLSISVSGCPFFLQVH